jgi:hypothetical protein
VHHAFLCWNNAKLNIALRNSYILRRSSPVRFSPARLAILTASYWLSSVSAGRARQSVPARLAILTASYWLSSVSAGRARQSVPSETGYSDSFLLTILSACRQSASVCAKRDWLFWQLLIDYPQCLHAERVSLCQARLAILTASYWLSSVPAGRARQSVPSRFLPSAPNLSSTISVSFNTNNACSWLSVRKRNDNSLAILMYTQFSVYTTFLWT